MQISFLCLFPASVYSSTSASPLSTFSEPCVFWPPLSQIHSFQSIRFGFHSSALIICSLGITTPFPSVVSYSPHFSFSASGSCSKVWLVSDMTCFRNFAMPDSRISSFGSSAGFLCSFSSSSFAEISRSFSSFVYFPAAVCCTIVFTILHCGKMFLQYKGVFFMSNYSESGFNVEYLD